MLTFKDYTMDQLQLPLSFEDFIPENHLVRVVNTIVGQSGPVSTLRQIQTGRLPCLSPTDDAEGYDLFLFAENILFPYDRKSSS